MQEKDLLNKMKNKKKYPISSAPNKIKHFRKRKIKSNNEELILLAHNICVDGLSKQRAEETIHNYVQNIKDYIDMEKEIKGYKIYHYIAITSFEKQGIKMLYPQMKQVMDNATKDGWTTETVLNRISKVYEILSDK